MWLMTTLYAILASSSSFLIFNVDMCLMFIRTVENTNNGILWGHDYNLQINIHGKEKGKVLRC